VTRQLFWRVNAGGTQKHGHSQWISTSRSGATIVKRPPILYILLTIAFASSAAVSLFGIMDGMWGGSPSMLAFLFWFLPVLSFPVSSCYFVLPRTVVIISWLLLIANYVAFFLSIWQSAVAGNTTTTNPFVIALSCLCGSPSISGLFAVAACLHLATRIERLLKALDTQTVPDL